MSDTSSLGSDDIPSEEGESAAEEKGSVWKRLGGVQARVTADPRLQALASGTLGAIKDERTRKVLRTVGGTVSVVAITAVARHVTRGLDPTGALAAQISQAVSHGLIGTPPASAESAVPPATPSSSSSRVSQESSTAETGTVFLPPRNSPMSSTYPTSPATVTLNWDHCGQIYKHPDLSSVWIEVSMLVSRDIELAVEWNNRCKRFWLAPADLSGHWQQVVYGPEIRFPLELCTTGPDTIMYRWTEPTLADLHADVGRPVVQHDPRVTAVNMNDYLRTAGGFVKVRR